MTTEQLLNKEACEIMTAVLPMYEKSTPGYTVILDWLHRYGEHANRVHNEEMAKEEMAECILSIHEFNKIAGNLDKPVDRELEATMLQSESIEYFDAKTPEELGDALCDCFVVLMGTVMKHGLMDKFFQNLMRVCKANMSKFCISHDEAKASIDKYAEQGIDVHTVYNHTHRVWVLFNSSGKIMKSINWKEPTFA